MDNNRINIGLAGCGHLGNIHARLINEIRKQNSSVNFTGVYDIDINKTTQTAGAYNVKAFNSLDNMLDEINTLIIVTPTPTHFDIARKAIVKKINLFIEKPVTSTLFEAEKLIEASKGSGLKIQIGHVERFNPALVSLEKYELNPRFIETHRLAQFNPRGTDVSVIQDLMIHDIDIILQLVKSPLEKIDASGVAVISNNIDIANARLVFGNGCAANITASRISLKKMRKMRIFQQNAYISIDFLQNKSEIFKLADIGTETKGITYPLSETKKIIFEEPSTENNANPIKNELETFIESIQKEKPVKVPLDEGKMAVEVADKIVKIISA